jgi:hypothetical protein
MSAQLNLESESPDTSKSSYLIQGAEIAPESLPRGSGLTLKTIARSLNEILQAESLEDAKAHAAGALSELDEIIRRYEVRRRAQEAQGENMVQVG